MALSMTNDILGSVVVSTRAAYRTPLEIVGSDGTLLAEDALNVERPITFRIRSRSGKERVIENISNELAYASQVDAFAAALAGEAPFPAPGLEGLRNQLVIDAAYRSWKSGRAEEVST